MNRASIVVFLFVINFIIFPLRLLAQSAQLISQGVEIRFIPRTSNQSSPSGGTRGTTTTDSKSTGSRGDCLSKSIPLTRLVGGSKLESTVSDRPTFWVYVPYAPEEASSGEFSLQDGEKNIYRTPFSLSRTPGIVSVTIPPTVKPLEIGKKYRWYFTLNCPQREGSPENSTPAFVTGQVQRIAITSELDSQLKAAKTALERAVIYAKNGIWYDTITELGQLRLKEPENREAINAWINLFKSEDVRLGEISAERIVGNIN
ncbi:DUF928 domain-containing protein [Argonema antarcticum]|uniref:DUF928 domain-containing protein n=1 Tax=Argonema antarcticum TaxID=2942763 RepID=UPI002011EA2D|nr:DUF928 domain-containing protein [Argonema antarcticum]MCL1474988.1 DUF928 domain-containing protein [Argonema antarcticum A004/B2]